MKEVIFAPCKDNMLSTIGSFVGEKEMTLYSLQEGARGAFIEALLVSKKEEVLSSSFGIKNTSSGDWRKGGSDSGYDQPVTNQVVLMTCEYSVKAVFGDSVLFTATKTYSRTVKGHIGEVVTPSAPPVEGQKAILRLQFSEVCSRTIELFGKRSPRYFFCNNDNKDDTVQVKSRKSFADCLLLPEGTGSIVSVFAGANGTTVLSVSDARTDGYIVV